METDQQVFEVRLGEGHSWPSPAKAKPFSRRSRAFSDYDSNVGNTVPRHIETALSTIATSSTDLRLASNRVAHLASVLGASEVREIRLRNAELSARCEELVLRNRALLEEASLARELLRKTAPLEDELARLRVELASKRALEEQHAAMTTQHTSLGSQLAAAQAAAVPDLTAPFPSGLTLSYRLTSYHVRRTLQGMVCSSGERKKWKRQSCDWKRSR